jgi:hypothetical protein
MRRRTVGSPRIVAVQSVPALAPSLHGSSRGASPIPTGFAALRLTQMLLAIAIPLQP